MMTLPELKERLAQEYDEVALLEILGIDAKMLVNHFDYLIENMYDELVSLFEEEWDDNED